MMLSSGRRGERLAAGNGAADPERAARVDYTGLICTQSPAPLGSAAGLGVTPNSEAVPVALIAKSVITEFWRVSMKKFIAALAAVTLVLGAGLASIPAYSADNPPAASGTDTKSDSSKSTHKSGSKSHKSSKHKKSTEGSTTSTTPPAK